MHAETTNHLISLGLTEYESKAVLALIKQGALEAPEISRKAEIPKTRVYDILEKLEEKGLVISLEGRPKKFQSIETEKMVEKLIESKRKEFKTIEETAFKLKEKLDFQINQEKTEKKDHIHKVKYLSDFDRILGQEILKAEKSVIGFTEIKEKRNFLEEALGKAIEKKVKVQMISSEKGIETFTGIDSRNSLHSLNAFVIDGKKIVLGLNNFKEKKPNYHFAILYNKSLADAISNHFQEKWRK